MMTTCAWGYEGAPPAEKESMKDNTFFYKSGIYDTYKCFDANGAVLYHQR